MAELTDLILDLLAEGHSPSEVAFDLVDREFSAGEFKGRTSELELAYNEYVAKAKRIQEEVGG